MRMMVRKLLLDRYDTNHDLMLDGGERHALMDDARAARRQRALAFIHRFDTDGDGHLNPGEHAAFHEEMERRHGGNAAPPPPHHGHQPPPPPMDREGRLIALLVHQLAMAAYDSDTDGQLNQKESIRLREDGLKLYQARKAALLSHYDSNQDGELNEAELHVAWYESQPPPPFGEAPPPPPPHAELPPPCCAPPPHHGAINHLIDTHFDIDILLHLASPCGEQPDSPPPCSPSTPSAT